MKRRHYDVLIAGARCAGAPTAMVLARQGLRVLVVDPVRRGSDTLSTHAVMRAGVMQLHRWGVLDAVRTAGTPPIRTTTFHYGDEKVAVAIKARDGVDALYNPRRTVLDPLLIDGATEAGAEVLHGKSVVSLIQDADGRVRGARVADANRSATEISADLVVGADGVRSRVARLVGAGVDYSARHGATSIYGYWKELGSEGNHWYYQTGASVGTIPTNDDDTCVFAVLPQERFESERSSGLETLHRKVLEDVSSELAADVASGKRTSGFRAFAGLRGFLRRSVGPGWVLVGDAGYFRDPITAHGITDALCSAEHLGTVVAKCGADVPTAYQGDRDERVRGLLDVSDRIASFEWDLDEIKDLHIRLSEEMKSEVEAMRGLWHMAEGEGSRMVSRRSTDRV